MMEKEIIKKDDPWWILAVVFIVLLIILNLVLFVKKSEYLENSEKFSSSEINDSASANFSFKWKTKINCPDAEGGNEKAILQIKYFYSDFCPWCRKEEPILQKIVKEQGNLVHISWYNLNICSDVVEKYKISGVPTLVFSTTDSPSEYSHYGFVYEEDLKKLVCDVTGGC